MDRRQFVIAATGGVALAAMSRGAWAEDKVALPDYYPADYGALIEASKSEGGVVLYTSFSDEFWQPAKNALKAMYPWIELQTLDLGGPEIIERYRMEMGAKARTADILVFNGPGEWFELSSTQALVDYQSAERTNLPDWSLKLPGAYFITADADTFTYNKLLLPDAPVGLEALVAQVQANPDNFRNRLTTYAPYQQSSYYLAFRKLLDHHGEKLWDWLAVLAPMTRIERSAGTMFEKILAGEYLLAYFINQQPAVMASRNPQQSQVVGYNFPADGTPISGRFGGIPVGTQTPNSSRLILDFLLSKPGQILVSAGGRFPYRADVTAADLGPNAYSYQMVVDVIGAENALLVEYDPKLFEDQEAIVARWKSIYEA